MKWALSDTVKDTGLTQEPFEPKTFCHAINHFAVLYGNDGAVEEGAVGRGGKESLDAGGW